MTRTCIVLFLAWAGIWLSACDRCCDDYENYDTYWYIEDSMLQKIPYQDGDLHHFRTAGGATLPYRVERTMEETIEEWDDHCGIEYNHYQVDITRLLPEDSGMEIKIVFDGSSSRFTPFVVEIGRNYFHIKKKTGTLVSSFVYDSLLVDGTQYFDVFHPTPVFPDTASAEYVPIDSVHYNYAYGILAVYFTDGERYVRVD